MHAQNKCYRPLVRYNTRITFIIIINIRKVQNETLQQKQKLKQSNIFNYLRNSHATHILPYLDDFNELIDATVTRKNRLSKQQLGQYTARRPNVCMETKVNTEYYNTYSSYNKISSTNVFNHISLAYFSVVFMFF